MVLCFRLILLFGILSLSIFHLKLGIDFKGGSESQVKFAQSFDIAKVQDTLSKENIGSFQTQTASDNNLIIKSQTLTKDQHDKIITDLQKSVGDLTETHYDSVGPIIGKELSQSAFWQLLCVSLGIIFLYWIRIPQSNKAGNFLEIWWRGYYRSISRFNLCPRRVLMYYGHFRGVEIDSLFVTGILTVLGFSVHDTIVVFDRIRENLRLFPGQSIDFVVNHSIAQTIVRSLNTSLTVLFVLLSLLLFGGETIRYFVFTLFIGIIVGTYSSIFIASRYWCCGRNGRQNKLTFKNLLYIRGFLFAIYLTILLYLCYSMVNIKFNQLLSVYPSASLRVNLFHKFMGILDTIITTKQNESLTQFKPSEVVKSVLDLLKDRDRKIIINRYGLEGQPTKTLAAIGQEQNLTRERVRQIEKDLIKSLKKKSLQKPEFASAKDFLLSIITEHGRIMAEENLLIHLNIADEREKNALIFILNLIEELESFIHANYKKSWVGVLFKEDVLHSFVSESKKIIADKNKPFEAQEFLENFKQTTFYQINCQDLSDKTILNYLELTIEIEKNVFGHWGLSLWKEVNPKDVGDKAYLVMKHHKKPEHYSAITEMINKAKFDSRKAFKETVHNELIKDQRFILVGRGIYALSEWGFKPGVVSDVIIEILKESSGPVAKDTIIEEVLKRPHGKEEYHYGWFI